MGGALAATVMVRKNVDLESWRNVVKYSYDSLLYFLCALNGSLHKIDDFTAVYRRHSNSVTNSSFGLRVQRMIWYSDLLKDIDKFSLFKYSDEIKKAISYKPDKNIKFFWNNANNFVIIDSSKVDLLIF